MAYRTSLALAFVSLVACSSPAPPGPPGPVTDITVSSGDLVPAFSATTYNYELTSLTTLFPVDITVSGQNVTINGAQAQDGVPLSTQIASLDDATTITINATDGNGAPVTYNIHSLPAAAPKYDVTTLASPTPGHILLTPTQLVGSVLGGPTFLYVIDETGKLLYYLKTPTAPTDFEQVKFGDGTVRYTYVLGDTPTNLATWPVEPASAVVMDDHFHELQRIRLLPSQTHPAAGVDAHEFKLLADDHWIDVSYIDEVITDAPRLISVKVASNVVQEVSGGNVVFDWETTSVPALFAQSSDTGHDFPNLVEPYQDVYHLNSVDIDSTNGNYVVSLRHCDEVVELDKTTGAVLWTLGGTGDDFGLAEADKSSHQHFARMIAPGDLTMFDNGNASGVTKIREYTLDTNAHTATVVHAITMDGHFSKAMGSAQKFGNAFFVGWGYRQASDSDVTEFDATTQQKSFELSFENGYASYRALKYPTQ